MDACGHAEIEFHLSQDFFFHFYHLLRSVLISCDVTVFNCVFLPVVFFRFLVENVSNFHARCANELKLALRNLTG